jgi:hypothetical protein
MNEQFTVVAIETGRRIQVSRLQSELQSMSHSNIFHRLATSFIHIRNTQAQSR